MLVNRYAGICIKCGYYVDVNTGWSYKRGEARWKTLCTKCIESIERREIEKKKVTMDSILDFLDGIKDKNRRQETCHDLIKSCREISRKAQVS